LSNLSPIIGFSFFCLVLGLNLAPVAGFQVQDSGYNALKVISLLSMQKNWLRISFTLKKTERSLRLAAVVTPTPRRATSTPPSADQFSIFISSLSGLGNLLI